MRDDVLSPHDADEGLAIIGYRHEVLVPGARHERLDLDIDGTA
jgi:hypothetical protein